MESAHAINVSDVKFREQFISRDGRLRPSRALGLYFSIGDKVFVRALRMPGRRALRRVATATTK
jgi:hypothetical protein